MRRMAADLDTVELLIRRLTHCRALKFVFGRNSTTNPASGAHDALQTDESVWEVDNQMLWFFSRVANKAMEHMFRMQSERYERYVLLHGWVLGS